MRTRQTFLMMTSAVLGLVATAGATLSVVNGNFENLAGLSATESGWYGGAAPYGWNTSNANPGGYTVAAVSGSYVANLDIGDLSQNIGSNDYNSAVTVSFDLGTFNTPPNVTVLLTDGTTVFARANYSSSIGLSLSGYVPARSPVIVKFLRGGGGSPQLDNVSVTSVEAALTVANGDFSNLEGLGDHGGGWRAGVPVGWAFPSASANYSVNTSSGTTPPVANLNGLNDLSQKLGQLAYPVDVTVSYLFETAFGAASFTAYLQTNAVDAVSQSVSTAGTKSMTLSNVVAGTALSVRFVNSAGSPALDNVSVSVTYAGDMPPLITSQPKALNAMISGTVRPLSVGAVGVEPLSYQWRSGGVVVTDQTNATLTASQAGNYDVVVTGGNSVSVTSSVAQVVAGLINGDFFDATGLTLGGSGWYSGTPYGWDTPYYTFVVQVSDGATPPTANLDGKTFVQTLGSLTSASDVFVTFDVSQPWSSIGQMTAYLLNGSSVVASSSYTTTGRGTLLAATLSATNVPAGAALAVKFVSANGSPAGLDNVKAYVLAPDGAPVITRLPAKTAKPAGTRASLSVLAVGVPPLAYQWLDGSGAALSGATGATLTVMDAGDYKVAVTAANGLSVTSGVAQVSGTLVNGDFSDLSGLGNMGGGWYQGMPAGWQSTRYPAGSLYNVSAGGGPSSAVCNPSTMSELQQPVGTLLRKSDVELTFDAPNEYSRANPWMNATVLDTSNPAYPQVLATTNVPFGTGYHLLAPSVPPGTALTIQFISAVADSPCGLDNVKVRILQPGLLVMIY